MWSLELVTVVIREGDITSSEGQKGHINNAEHETYICSTLVITEHYLWEQIRKGTGQSEGIFMQTVLAEHDRILRLHTLDSRAHTESTNATSGDSREERDHVIPIQQSQKPY